MKKKCSSPTTDNFFVQSFPIFLFKLQMTFLPFAYVFLLLGTLSSQPVSTSHHEVAQTQSFRLARNSISTASFFEMLCRVPHEKPQLEIITNIQTDPSNSFSFDSKSQTLAMDTNLFMVLTLWRWPLSTMWQFLVSEIL